MSIAVIDDHLLRDVLAGSRKNVLLDLGFDRVATTGLWLFRLCAAFASPAAVGKLSAPVSSLEPHLRERFREKLTQVPRHVEMIPLRDLSWSMAELQQRHRTAGRNMSALMLEALAAAHHLSASLVVSKLDVGPNLQIAAQADGIPFIVV